MLHSPIEGHIACSITLMVRLDFGLALPGAGSPKWLPSTAEHAGCLPCVLFRRFRDRKLRELQGMCVNLAAFMCVFFSGSIRDNGIWQYQE